MNSEYQTTLSLLLLCTMVTELVAVDSFYAAVLEHDVTYPANRTRVLTRQEALDVMTKNLRVYADQAHNASKQNASITIYPEYGLYGIGWTRQTIRPYLEYVPDPDRICWNPCDKPAGFPNDEVQSYLSCIAKNNSMYIVANIGARQPCHVTNPDCPKDGALHYSTNVVYNQNGDFVARYFKFNIDKDSEVAYLDKPQVVNYTTFDTPFGRFATFTSLDILYKEPAVTLITKMNITNIAYPTAWKEALPLMTAIEFHSAFSEGLLINLLAANLHLPDLGYYGSGLYWPTGTSIDGIYVYDDAPKSPGVLVAGHLKPFVIPPDNDQLQSQVKSDIQFRNISETQSDSISKTHKLTINGDEYTALILTREDVGGPHVCQGEVCCDASVEAVFSEGERFAFGVFDGYHGNGEDAYYIQACVFIKCASHTPESCGQPMKQSPGEIGKMSMVANFTSSGIVYPEVLTSQDGGLGIVTRTWLYQGSIIIDAGLYGGPISIAMVNRIYSRDKVRGSP